MRYFSPVFGFLALLVAALGVVPACSSPTRLPIDSTMPGSLSKRPAVYVTATPPAKLLYVDHDGRLAVYTLPLTTRSKPLRTLVEAPDQTQAPAIAVAPSGEVAIATTLQLRIFRQPVSSFEPGRATLRIPLTPAITQVGPNGADLIDLEFDPGGNLWLFSGLGGDISELQRPLSSRSVASTTIQFGAPGSATGGFALVQGRFDVNSTLYIYGTGSQGGAGSLFRVPFPYSKPPARTGLNLVQADFVDPTQFPYGPPQQYDAGLVLGQYYGPRASTPPLSPTPPPVDELSQFAQPLDAATGLFPNVSVHRIVGALAADPPRNVFYTLDAGSGSLSVFALPLTSNARAILSLPCTFETLLCDGKPEHLFLVPQPAR